MGANNNLQKAKATKDDEFYTRETDIEKEVKHYRKHFEGKTVYCNCDDHEWSSFFQYFRDHFRELKLKKLIATHYTVDSENDKPYKLECVSISNINGIPKTYKYEIDGDGDFRSEECIKLLKESDIVCTNPPFSLFREYIAQLIEYDKKFLVIGSTNAITYKQVFSLIKDNKMWIGVSPRSMKFDKNIERTESKDVNACWFTNLSHKKRNDEIILWKKYEPKEYPKYDNFYAIEVCKVNELPIDYDGIMGVPITFLEKYNPAQFTIIDIAKRGPGDPLSRSKFYTKEEFKNYSDMNAGPVIKNGDEYKNIYPRILIKLNNKKEMK